VYRAYRRVARAREREWSGCLSLQVRVRCRLGRNLNRRPLLDRPHRIPCRARRRGRFPCRRIRFVLFY